MELHTKYRETMFGLIEGHWTWRENKNSYICICLFVRRTVLFILGIEHIPRSDALYLISYLVIPWSLFYFITTHICNQIRHLTPDTSRFFLDQKLSPIIMTHIELKRKGCRTVHFYWCCHGNFILKNYKLRNYWARCSGHKIKITEASEYHCFEIRLHRQIKGMFSLKFLVVQPPRWQRTKPEISWLVNLGQWFDQ